MEEETLAQAVIPKGQVCLPGRLCGLEKGCVIRNEFRGWRWAQQED